MARYFQITAPEGMSNPKLDSQGCATLQLKAKNVTGAALDGRAILISLPVVSPAAGAVQNGWVKIDGTAEQHFEKDQEKVFVVKIAVPKKNAKPGNYQFRMDVVSVAVTDQGDSSQVFVFTVAEVKNVESHFPMWLIPVLAILVIGLGVGIYFLLHNSGGLTVPDLAGKTVTEATPLLADAKLTLGTNVQTADSTADSSGKIIDQTPKAGASAKQGDSVQVTVGAQKVTVPRLIGLTLQEAMKKLRESNLAPGDTKTAASANFAGGVVWDQKPAENEAVKASTAVDLSVTPQTVEVRSVAGQSLGSAIIILRNIGLDVGSLSGNTTATVASQSPASGPVPVGTKVNLAFPETGLCARIVCRFQGNAANKLVYEAQKPRAAAVHW
jgi:beta-lactam-binding protein with PASTA domain